MAEFAERMELLRRVRLFAGLNDDDLSHINELLTEKRFRKGSVVFQQGDVGDALYIIEAGRVKASIKDDQAREKILAVFGEGDYFGEMALLSDQPRTATMTVVGDAELLVLPKDIFERFLAGNLTVMRQFVNLMSRRLAETSAMTTRDTEAEEKMVLGKVIAVFSPKGGTGKTSLTVNLATVLREQTGKSVCIMDCSYPFGDVGVMLNLDPKRTVVDLLPHINEMGGEILESILQSHASGVKALLAPPTPEESELVTAEAVSICISALRELYEFILVDTHSSFTEVSIAALDAADLILVVTTLELPSLKDVRVFLDTATQKLGYPTEKLALVVNRASPVGGLSLADVEASVGMKVVATISSSGAVAVGAANQGVPFVISNKESQIYRDVVALAKLIAPQALEEQGEDLLDIEEEEAPTLRDRIRAAPAALRAAVLDGVASLKASDILIGLGSLFLVSAPFMLVFGLLGLVMSKASDGQPSPAFNLFYNLSVWVGILGGTFLVDRLQEPRKSAWVLGGILGASYGLMFSFASIAVLNAAGGSLRTPVFALFFYVIPYALLGIIGSFLAGRTRPRAQALLT
ncbi:MAG: cyclic nucleotide-binding domain-containing protein [Chloroflexi bacterium]|nr:cyclic nucleotide-binding domain-containing protein [Chloroflexota bacterium]